MTDALERALRMDCRAAERLRAMGAAPLPSPAPVPDLAAAVREAQRLAGTAPTVRLPLGGAR